MAKLSKLSPLLRSLGAVAVLSFAVGESALGGIILQNLTLAELDANGHYTNAAFSDTSAASAQFDLFVIRGTDAAGGSFINVAPNGAVASLSEVPILGDNTFTAITEPGRFQPNANLNLFFNDSINANISEYIPFGASGATPTPTSEPTLNPFGSSLSGAGALVYTSGALTVSLISMAVSQPGLDRVGPRGLGTSGQADIVTQFTLRVTAVPEPSGLLSASLGLAGLVVYAGCRRAFMKRLAASNRPAGGSGDESDCLRSHR